MGFRGEEGEDCDRYEGQSPVCRVHRLPPLPRDDHPSAEPAEDLERRRRRVGQRDRAAGRQGRTPLPRAEQTGEDGKGNLLSSDSSPLVKETTPTLCSQTNCPLMQRAVHVLLTRLLVWS